MSFEFRPVMPSSGFEAKQVKNNGGSSGNTGYQQQKKKQKDEDKDTKYLDKDETDSIILKDQKFLDDGNEEAFSDDDFSFKKLLGNIADTVRAKILPKPSNPFQNL